MEEITEDQALKFNEDLRDKISSDSMSLAVSEVLAKRYPKKLNTPNKLRHIYGRFGEYYVNKRNALKEKYNLSTFSRIVASEYEIVSLRERNWWKLSIESGMIIDSENNRQFVTEEHWWRGYLSKSHAFYEHINTNIITKRLRDLFPDCNNDNEVIDLVIDIHSINLLADIDSRAASLLPGELLEEMFEFFDIEALAQFSVGWNSSESNIKQMLSGARARGALMRLEKDPISKAKNTAKGNIKGLWRSIPETKKTYGWKAEFARLMQNKYPIIEDVKTITGWVTEWEKL